ncbi:hypothetical protein BaRGS_00013480 [Batillaria attramentaria]|uniref:Uncharacterized protein n=1 Tax=Batillaria attramentaria TaxID=370345 RepID=A0ABD0L7K7_9CAEN
MFRTTMEEEEKICMISPEKNMKYEIDDKMFHATIGKEGGGGGRKKKKKVFIISAQRDLTRCFGQNETKFTEQKKKRKKFFMISLETT